MTHMKKAIKTTFMLVTAVTIFAIVGCDKKNPEPDPQFSLKIIDGQDQQGIVDQPLADLIKVRVVDEKGNRVDNAEVKFTSTGGTDYATTEQGMDTEYQWTLGPTPGPQTLEVEFEKSGQSGSQQVRATGKFKPCIEENFTFVPTPITFIPPHNGVGDQEYNGHGPNISVTALVYRDGTSLKVRLYMKAVETQQDWTTAEGTEIYDITPAGIPANREMKDILTATQFSMSPFIDTDHQMDVIFSPSGNLISKCELIGDSSGKDAGINTRVTVYFNPITLLLREVGDCE